jgi:hypothetical protein
MEDKEITKKQLTNKLVKLSRRIPVLEKSVVVCQQVEESLRKNVWLYQRRDDWINYS